MRDIKDIYDDIKGLYSKYGRSKISVVDFKNHTGDSQLISHDFLQYMYDMLKGIIESCRKSTRERPYSAEHVYLLDSGWWGLTNAQSSEASDLFLQNYGNSWRLYDVGYWDVDELSQFRQPTVGMSGGHQYSLYYDGGIVNYEKHELSVMQKGYYNDRYVLTDFNEVKNGSFYNPSYVGFESWAQVESWLSAYDSILSILKSSTFVYWVRENSTDINTTMEFDKVGYTHDYHTSSDLYRGSAYFSEFEWHDDEQGTNGFIVKQVGSLRSFSSITVSISYEVYSENKTVKHDDGEGGYIDVIYSTEDNGVTFGDTPEDIRQLAISTWPDTNSATFVAWPSLENQFPKYINQTSTFTVLGNDYVGGTMTRNRTGEFSLSGRTVINAYNYDKQYVRNPENYIIKRKYAHSMSDKENWEADVFDLYEEGKNPAVIISVVQTEDGSFENEFELPSYPTTGTMNLEMFNVVAGINIPPEVEIYTLQPPV